MGRRGPAPTPPEILKLRGSRRANANADRPQPPRTRPECPAWLDAEGQAVWQALVPELDNLGLLTVVDGAALAAFCTAVADLRWAEETIGREGRVVRTGGQKDPASGVWEGGQLQPHPAVAIRNKAREAIKAFSALFGLDPSARSRLVVPRDEKPQGVSARRRESLSDFARMRDGGAS